VDISVDGPVADRKSEDDPFQSKGGDKAKRVSIGNTIISSDRDSTQTLKQEMDEKLDGKIVVAEDEVTTSAEADEAPAPVDDSQEPTQPADADIPAPQPTPSLTAEEEHAIEAQAEAQLHNEVAKSFEVKKSVLDKPQLQRKRSTSSPLAALQVRKKEERLSLQIPGSFDG
jgi:hypothetical protein